VIPLKDSIPSSTRPFVTYALIAANSLAFLWELSAPNLIDYTLVPARFTAHPSLAPIVTSMFLHGGWLHLIGNMLYLWIFGDNVEDRVGHVRYVLLYFAGGIAAALAQVYMAPDSSIPMVGASGAIAAVLGAYLVLYPHARVYTLIPLFFGVIAVPAVLYLGFWFVLQVISGVSSLGATEQGGVAFFAHVGGFVSGVVLVKLLDRGPARLPPQWPVRRWA
jgi:membrane associated rhomboid family serine protease